MQLPAALFEEITGMPACSANPRRDESPIANWVFLGQSTILLRNPLTGDATCHARIRRISIEGIGLLHESPIEVGEEFTMMLPRLNHQPITVRCKSVRCEGGADGLYRIGAVYTSILSEEYADAADRGSGQSFVDRPIRSAILAA